MYRERLLAPVLRRASRTFPVVMLTGARQVGKTTLLRHLEPNRRWVSFDDMDLRRLAQDDPRLFLERFPPPVFLDEFQYAPEILPYIKIRVDERRTRLQDANGAFWLSGSQNFAMMRGVQESLAGRVAILRLLGFSRAESGRAPPPAGKPCFESPRDPFDSPATLPDYFGVILRGDKPQSWVQPRVDRQGFYASYIQTVLERDVRSQLGVRQLSLFDKCMRSLAARVGQLLNMASIAGELGVSIPTVREWLTILERSDQILLLQPYFSNLNKRLVKTPKIYFLDTGLVAHLLKWSDVQTTLAGPMAGSLFENWVVSEIVKSYRHRGLDPNLYFLRTRDGLEIDLLREVGGGLHAAEIKLASSVQSAIPALLKAARSLGGPLRSLRIICTARRSLSHNGVSIIPAWSIS